MAPPVSALNPSQKRRCSPEPPCRQEPVEPNAPVSLPANDQSGFSAEQLATIKALIQSCLTPPTLFSPYSASAPSLPAPILPTTPASDTPRAGPSWVSVPQPPTPPLTGPSGIQPPQSLSPRPGPSWASDPPLVEESGELTDTAELVVLSDLEEGDAVTPPVGRSRLDPLHLAAAEVLDRLWHDTPADTPLLSPSTEDPAHRDLYALFQTRIPRYLLLDESRERSAAHHYWSLLHPLQLARDLATVTDSTVFTVKQEGLRSLPLPTLLQGIQGAFSLTFDHLEDVCVRSLTKAVQAKVKIRELMLGAIKPHTLRDPLLQSDLLHPEIFPPSALDTALTIFKTALDMSSLCDHAGRLPFQAPRSGFPRCRHSRRGSNRDPRSLPAPASNRPTSTSDELRGGVLSNLRRQVADLRAQISTTASPSPARTSGRGRGSAPPRDRSARRGRNFFG